MNPTLAALQRAEEAKRKAKASLVTDDKLAWLTMAVDILIEAVTDMAAQQAEHREREAA